ncbi:MAG: hypothetical protein ACI835_001702, partial [Planctomycetota bacterium]
EEFQALVLQHSEDRQSRDQAGSLGVTRQHSRTVPDLVLRETFAFMSRVPGNVRGCVLGPMQVQGASALVCLGDRTPAPSWAEMATHVHRELRRRFLSETLLPNQITTWLD